MVAYAGGNEGGAGRAGHALCPLGIHKKCELCPCAVKTALRMADGTGGDAIYARLGLHQRMGQRGQGKRGQRISSQQGKGCQELASRSASHQRDLHHVGNERRMIKL